MNNITPGTQTSEFKMTAFTNVVNAILALLIAYGLLTADTAAIWQSVILSLVVFAIPIATALMNKEYTRGRTALKIEAMQPGAAQARAEAAE
ncbi:MAG: hypothetical protein IAF02_11275 [Anaerolineae bacterium]|nr:hypothetical protein [Anaerolineae bacterium]